jgi:hypothetical protein
MSPERCPVAPRFADDLTAHLYPRVRSYRTVLLGNADQQGRVGTAKPVAEDKGAA